MYENEQCFHYSLHCLKTSYGGDGGKPHHWQGRRKWGRKDSFKTLLLLKKKKKPKDRQTLSYALASVLVWSWQVKAHEHKTEILWFHARKSNIKGCHIKASQCLFRVLARSDSVSVVMTCFVNWMLGESINFISNKKIKNKNVNTHVYRN